MLERDKSARGENRLFDVSKKMALACHIEGQGPDLIMFHGGTGSWTHWIRNVPALREHFTVHAYDLPGNGDSPSVPADITPHDYVDIVCESIRDVGGATRPVYLCGFSFGGVVAAMLTARMPEKVSRLALVTPGGLRGAPGAGSGRSRLNLRKMPSEPVPEDERRAILRHNLMQMMFVHEATITEETVDIQRDNVARQRFNTQPFTGGSLTRAALPKIKVPTLGIFGARDNLSWPDVSARVDPCRELMPAMRIELIPDAGHWVQYERPEPVNRLLIEFFKQGHESRHPA
jgi:pimeloyl-ACP methyl ester carboxylesterase